MFYLPKLVFSLKKQIYLHTHIIHTLFLKPNFFPYPILQTPSVCWSTLPTAQPPPSLSREGLIVWHSLRPCVLLRMRGIVVEPVVERIAVLPAVRDRLTLMVLICANWKVMLIQYVLMDNKREICALMIAVGIQVANAPMNTTRLVMAPMSKARELLVGVNIKNVVKSVPDTIIHQATFQPDTSKTEAVRAVPVLNIRLNAILTAATPELMLTAALQAAAAQAVKMTAELITPNALARPCMNGARQRKNAYVRRGTNILAPAATLAAVRATAAMENIRNANVKPDSRGVPPAACAFVTVRIGVRLTKIAPAWGISNRAVRNYQSNVRLILTMFIV